MLGVSNNAVQKVPRSALSTGAPAMPRRTMLPPQPSNGETSGAHRNLHPRLPHGRMIFERAASELFCSAMFITSVHAVVWCLFVATGVESEGVGSSRYRGRCDNGGRAAGVVQCGVFVFVCVSESKSSHDFDLYNFRCVLGQISRRKATGEFFISSLTTWYIALNGLPRRSRLRILARPLIA